MTQTGNDREAAALRLVDAALDMAPGDRVSFVKDQTKDDPALRARVLRLLDVSATPLSLTGQAAEVLADVADGDAPKTIGQYDIVSLIGKGGMGAVYLGRRRTGDFDHEVAIKVVRGLRNIPSLTERLRTERQTLARLKHPNIAQLFDGGETDAGDPYFIMEYIDGHPLRTLIDDGTSLATYEKLGLFVQICAAVQHAHQQLIIHRDLSPSNILVTDDWIIKLIDFGISQSISAGSDDGPRYTLTKGYAAPERLRGEPATTLSDVYALGVILRDLVGTDPAPRRADLAAIISRATADAPGACYSDVSGLMADVERYRHKRSVTAHPGSPLYYVRRFIGRHPVGVGAAVVAASALVVTLATISVLLVRAERAEAEAIRRFEDVRSLAKFIVFDLYDELAKVEGTTTAREMVADQAKTYFDALRVAALADTELSIETALGYGRLADVSGNPIGANLGRRDDAFALYQQAVDILAPMATMPDSSPALRRDYASLLQRLATFYFIAVDESENTIRLSVEAQDVLGQLIAAGDGDENDVYALSSSYAQEGMAHAWSGSQDPAMAALRQAVALIDELPEARRRSDEAQRARANALTHLGDGTAILVNMTEVGDYALAIPPLVEAAEIYRKLIAEDSARFDDRRRLMNALIKLSQSLDAEEMYTEEIAALDEATALGLVLAENDPSDLSILRRQTAILKQSSTAFTSIGNLDRVVTTAQQAVANARRLAEADPGNDARIREIADAGLMLASALSSANRWTEACPQADEVTRIFRDLDARGALHDAYRTFSVPQIQNIVERCREKR